MEELIVLRTLSIRGRATPESLTPVLHPEGPSVSEIIDRLVDAGEVEVQDADLHLSDRGRQRVDDRLAEERAAMDRPALEGLYQDFCGHNNTFKKLATDWQLRKMGSQSVPNDHTDPAYDGRVVRRLGRLHRRMVPLMSEVETHIPRMASYSRRLSRAKERLVDDGDQRFFTSLFVDSYHTVWFELHEELIVCLDLTRHDGGSEGAAGG